MRRFLVLMLALSVPLVFTGCAEDDDGNGGTQIDEQASEDNVDLGVLSLYTNMQSEEQDFTEAYNYFEQAVRYNPNNLDAHLGAGVTNILRLPNHPAITAVMDSLGLEIPILKSPPWSLLESPEGRTPASPLARAIFGSLAGRTQGPTDIGLLLDLIIGELDVSINHLNRVETDPDYEWLFPNPSGTGPDTVEIDVTDVHFVEGPLQLTKALLQGLRAYELELPSLDQQGFIAALSQDSDFMTLANPGSIDNAEASMSAGAVELQTAANLLEAETDDQTDDFVRLLFEGEEFAEWPAMTEGQLDTMQAMPTILEDLMTTPMEIVDDFDSNESTPDDTVFVNIGVVFTDPIVDWKAIFPNYEIAVCEDTTMAILWEATTIDQWFWHPDSLHGLMQLPGAEEMTSDDMVEIFGLEFMFDMGGCK